ncbi:hypothetical protein CWE15_02660 [Aliidiomarina taiwanensis]|uniref:Fluoride-specific ion channel FluC n=1 Tax=Aliidiomarina taiwanensis TaxID=946228 RepID=A0A432X9J4_9GAMM|nr:CrcB family protein [Aliidiomarina taiwanensis]RUO44093.1 hypothetical protein CWE15_02660 [Aliidiomarina taiwanensis]
MAINKEAILWVALGGALGASARYGVTLFFQQSGTMGFPFEVVVVNILGSLYLGLVAGLVSQGIWPARRLWLHGAGFAGALTTFSTFATDAVELMLQHEYVHVAGFVLTQVGVGLVLCYTAMRLVMACTKGGSK